VRSSKYGVHHLMWIRRTIGIVLVALGGVWIAQGSGALHGSFMTGEGLWTVIGVIVGFFGIALLVGAARDSKRAARDEG
jgi:4-hydroxybenzoate polyprenyltransferase